ncbi:hypothetical protein SPADD19_00833 [Streptococcus parasanguinis]|nr:hypothetical protein SPADD19_00833 [Streptococcus parasanguinis]
MTSPSFHNNLANQLYYSFLLKQSLKVSGRAHSKSSSELTLSYLHNCYYPCLFLVK